MSRLMMQSKPVLHFEYESLAEDIREAAMADAVEIIGAIEQAHETAWAIGRSLVRMQERLEHGTWIDWLRDELGWHERRAQLLMNVYRRFSDPDEYVRIIRLPASAQQALAAPSTPDNVIDAVVTRVELGEKLSVRDVKELVREGKEPPAATVVDVEAAIVRSYESDGEMLTLFDVSQTLNRPVSASVYVTAKENVLRRMKQETDQLLADQTVSPFDDASPNDDVKEYAASASVLDTLDNPQLTWRTVEVVLPNAHVEWLRRAGDGSLTAGVMRAASALFKELHRNAEFVDDGAGTRLEAVTEDGLLFDVLPVV